MTQTDKEKIKNAVRIIDKYLELYLEQRHEHSKLDIFSTSDTGGYNYEYDKLNNRTINRLQEIRDELTDLPFVPKEEST